MMRAETADFICRNLGLRYGGLTLIQRKVALVVSFMPALIEDLIGVLMCPED